MKTKSICPSCKTILEFDRTKFSVVKCPKCNYSGNVTDFKEKEEVELTEKTEVRDKNNLYKPGKLEFLESDTEWLQKEKTITLSRGINTIGRKSPNSTSSIQLPVADTYMSRNHAAIEVIMKADAVFEHRLSDNKSVNGTFHNGDRLDEGDIIKLMPGDTIRFGHTVLKFIAE